MTGYGIDKFFLTKKVFCKKRKKNLYLQKLNKNKILGCLGEVSKSVFHTVLRADGTGAKFEYL